MPSAGVAHQDEDTFHSIRPAPPNDRWKRTEQNAQVKRQAPVLHIINIEKHHFVKSEVAATAHLPETGDAWAGGQPLLVPFLVLFHLLGQIGARANQAHLPAHYVVDLREFIQAEATEKTTNARSSRVIAQLEERAAGFV